ncbi:hypothetical protein [Sporosarcina limicola]|uniref:Holin n=1 Tax=Sporosarcina limicola TaxID=34101 RepID=A0A927MIQ1_9BACL|nr:hypothetical protein [Sporosarcina limicola]MBE1555338.1 hypothetical protein [Sporosarcina limicola]
MYNELPVIHTNIWDALLAVPIILIIVFLLRMFFKLSESWFSTAATAAGLVLAIFISHSGNLPAGIFMGFFYGGAASGTIYSLKVWFNAYRKE